MGKEDIGLSATMGLLLKPGPKLAGCGDIKALEDQLGALMDSRD